MNIENRKTLQSIQINIDSSWNGWFLMDLRIVYNHSIDEHCRLMIMINDEENHSNYDLIFHEKKSYEDFRIQA